MLNRLKDSRFFVSLTAREVICTVFAIVFIITTVCSFNYSMGRTVTLTDGEKTPIEIKTTKGTVKNLLLKQGIALNTGDKMNVALEDNLKDNMSVEIYRAMEVSVTAMGETKEYLTTKRVVGDILEELGFNANPSDICEPALDKRVEDSSSITFIKTSEDTVDVEEEIPYECKQKISKSLASGKSQLVQKGQSGEKVLSYKVHYQDGVEVFRELVSEKIVKEAVDEVKEVGPKEKIDYYQIASAGSITTSRSGELSYSKVILCSASAYDLSYESCGKSPGQAGYGVTASGARAQYGVVAVDPSVIPIGTKLYIEATDGSWAYGNAVAGDTGGAIKGNKIDLFFNTHAEALRFGRRQAKVYILK